MNQQPLSMLNVLGRAAATILLASILGVALGALFARIAPEDKFSWVGLAMVPLWLLLEIFLEGAVFLRGAQSKYVRLLSTITLLSGFYVAWFAFRGIGP